MKVFRLFLKAITVILPWRIKRIALIRIFGFEIHHDARIGLSWIYPKKLSMEAKSKIGNFNVAVNLDSLEIGHHSSIGRRNWITGFPTYTDSPHFVHEADRKSELIIGPHSAITKNHHIDCTNTIRLGEFVTIAGYYSQLLTHSIDLKSCRQASSPISIGDYCFVGTNVVILGGSKLPCRSVLGAKSLLNQSFESELSLYGGVPAKHIQALSNEYDYFNRKVGFVV